MGGARKEGPSRGRTSMGEGRKQDNELIPISDESQILKKTENTCGIIPCNFMFVLYPAQC